MGRYDNRCDALTGDGERRCTRQPVLLHHEFAWCWQHARMVRGESVHATRRELGEPLRPTVREIGRRAA